MFQKNQKITTELQKLKDIYELFELYGGNLNNMDPDQLKILQLDFLDCFTKTRGV